MRETRWLAFVESNTTGSGRQFCAEARARGLRPVVLTRSPERYPYLEEDRIAVLETDTGDGEEVLARCRELAAEGLAGVGSSSEYFIGMAAATAGRLSLPGPDPEAVAACRDKETQWAVLDRQGVPVPGARAVNDAAEAVEAAAELGFPVVLKPTTGSGSEGVRLCGDADEVRRWALRMRGLAVFSGRILVEEYIPGPEFSVEIFDSEAVAVVAKRVSAPPYFVEVGHDYPAALPEPELSALAARAVEATGALGLDWGPCHVELRLSKRGPVVIEVNPRLAGGMIPALIRASDGIDLVGAVIARVSGQTTDEAVRAKPGRRYGAIRFVVLPGTGTIGVVRGAEEARAMPGVRSVDLVATPGREMAITHSFRDRLGHVIATGTSPADAADRAEAAVRRIEVEIRAPETDIGFAESISSGATSGAGRGAETRP